MNLGRRQLQVLTQKVDQPLQRHLLRSRHRFEHGVVTNEECAVMLAQACWDGFACRQTCLANQFDANAVEARWVALWHRLEHLDLVAQCSVGLVTRPAQGLELGWRTAHLGQAARLDSTYVWRALLQGRGLPSFLPPSCWNASAGHSRFQRLRAGYAEPSPLLQRIARWAAIIRTDAWSSSGKTRKLNSSWPKRGPIASASACALATIWRLARRCTSCS